MGLVKCSKCNRESLIEDRPDGDTWICPRCEEPQACHVNVRLSIDASAYACGVKELTAETEVIAIGIEQIKRGCRQAFEDAYARIEPALDVPVVSRVKAETGI